MRLNRLTNLDPTTGLKFTPANHDLESRLVRPIRKLRATLGLVYQLTSKTVVRAGLMAGLYVV